MPFTSLQKIKLYIEEIKDAIEKLEAELNSSLLDLPQYLPETRKSSETSSGEPSQPPSQHLSHGSPEVPPESLLELLAGLPPWTRIPSETPEEPPSDSDGYTSSEREVSPDVDSVILEFVDLAGRSRSPTPGSDPLPDLCVRCFNSWLEQVDEGSTSEISDCEWGTGRRQKKCNSCSAKRSECVKIPYAIRRPLMRRKALMTEALAESDLPRKEYAQARFARAYYATHGVVKAELSSQERNRRRDRAAAQGKKRKAEVIEKTEENPPSKIQAVTDNATVASGLPQAEGIANPGPCESRLDLE